MAGGSTYHLTICVINCGNSGPNTIEIDLKLLVFAVIVIAIICFTVFQVVAVIWGKNNHTIQANANVNGNNSCPNGLHSTLGGISCPCMKKIQKVVGSVNTNMNNSEVLLQLGQRQKVLEARRRQKQREENERINVDLLEVKHQAKERKAVIKRAKVQYYYQADCIKELHGALVHAEALKERDVQLEIKRLKDKLSVEQDGPWYVRYQRDFEAFNDADQNQIKERRRKNVLAADYQRSQIRHHQDEQVSTKDEDMKEGERLKKQAEEYEEELKQKAEERRRKALQQSADNRNQIEDIRYMKQVEETQREEEDEECRVFAKAKRNIMKLRAAKEKEMRDEKIENLTKIQEKLALLMKEKQDDEDERIKQAVEEKEARRLKEEKESEERRLKRIKAVEEHRQEQMKVMERRKEEEKLEVVEMVKARKEADTVWFANELERLNKRRMEAEQLDTDQRQQAEERRKLENQEDDQDLEQERKNRELVVEEEKEFQDYAQDLNKL